MVTLTPNETLVFQGWTVMVAGGPAAQLNRATSNPNSIRHIKNFLGVWLENLIYAPRDAPWKKRFLCQSVSKCLKSVRCLHPEGSSVLENEVLTMELSGGIKILA